MFNRLSNQELRTRNRFRSVLAPVGDSHIEALESRLFLSAVHHVHLHTISGRIFFDLLGNGIRKPKDHWLAGVTVFLDLNHTGTQDLGDPLTVTNKSGTFFFRRLPAGMYDVVVVSPTGDAPTIPATATAVVDITRHAVLNLRFGQHQAPIVPPPVDTSPPGGGVVAVPITASGNTPYRFTVTWSDATAVDVSSLGDGNLIVTGPNGYNQPATLAAIDVSTSGSPRTATYQISAPSGGWIAGDDGTYTFALQGGQVRDTLGNTDPALSLGTFAVNIPANQPGAPALVGGTNGAIAKNNSSVSNEISVSVSGTLAGAQLTLDADGFAIGSAVAAAGTTVMSSNGQMRLSDGTHQFLVVQTLPGGTPVASPVTNVVIDSTGPSAQLTASPITTAGATSYSFSVTYMSLTAVSASSLAGTNLQITNPGNQVIVPTLLSVDSNADGPTRTATYTISAPQGAWSAAADGTYTVTLVGGQVFDVLHNAAAGKNIGAFTVSIGLTPATGTPALTPASDTGAFSNDGVTDLNNSSPAAELQISVPETQAGDTVTVFSDGIAIGSAMASGTTTIVTTNGSTKIANGSHLLTARQMAPAMAQSPFSAETSILVDNSPPSASCTPPQVNAAGATSYTFSVTYIDNLAINVTDLANGNVVVTGPNGFSAPATKRSVNNNSDGSPRMVTYSITPPGGSWQAADNGTYTLDLPAGQIFDTAGNSNADTTLGTFMVNLSAPTTAAPSAPTLAAASDTGTSNSDGLTNLNNSSPTQTLQFNVGSTISGATVTVYSDGTAIGTAVASGSTTTVTTDGVTTLPDGVHSITATQVSPGALVSATSSAMMINIETSVPTASGTFSDLTTPDASYSFTVMYTDLVAIDPATITSSNIVVTGPNGYSAPAIIVSTDQTSPSPTINATYQILPNGPNWSSTDDGQYTISLQNSQVSNTAGTPVAGGLVGTFNISI